MEGNPFMGILDAWRETLLWTETLLWRETLLWTETLLWKETLLWCLGTQRNLPNTENGSAL
jgi:hypothetical protein